MPPAYWEKMGERHAMQLFAFAAKTVPAYKTFLLKNGVRPALIKHIKDYQKVPIMNKNIYLRKYSYPDLFPNRELTATHTFSATSGSTGEPFYFPRNSVGDKQYQYFSEVFLVDQFAINQKKTLVILSFGFGMWIAGISTFTYLNALAEKGYPLTVVPTGPNIHFFLGTIKKFAKEYDQVILFGYPPLLKDILDEGQHYGVSWKKYHIKIVTSGEGFSEEFRSYIAKKAGIKNPLLDIVGLYGSTELSGMARETPLSILIRKIAQQHKKVFSELFPGVSSMPSLCQYHPQLIYFEEQEGNLLVTGNASVTPLLRYQFPDRGGVISYNTMRAKLRGVGFDMDALIRKANIARYVMKLPFVYVSERSDKALFFYGINIYPESIKIALFEKSITHLVTGRFYMETIEDKTMRKILNIHIELKAGLHKNEAIHRAVHATVITVLRTRHAEYNHLFLQFPKRALPHINLWNYHSKPYFEIGQKHRWIPKF